MTFPSKDCSDLELVEWLETIDVSTSIPQELRQRIYNLARFRMSAINEAMPLTKAPLILASWIREHIGRNVAERLTS